MTKTYTLKGMTCGSCEQTIKQELEQIPGVELVTASKDRNEVEVTSNEPLNVTEINERLKKYNGKYSFSEQLEQNEVATESQAKSERTWFQTYKPILLIFTYLLTTTLAIQGMNGSFDYMQWMRHFMAGFFLVFSFFKLLDLKGFAESYQMYDVIARRFPAWGYIYAWIELLLGFAYLTNFNPVITNSVTFIVMSVSIIGVLQSVLNKKSIQCACIGNVFDLPMSTVTIVEDGLMILMSFIMLLQSV